jgi:S-(hydroxymethyl)glutathione dehydrogenase/alcohol dehydrogenase
MKTKAAVLWGPNQDWQVEEVELGDPVDHEVQVRLSASGLCHSDEHARVGDLPMVEPGDWPFIGGHEGAGVVTKVGKGVSTVSEGDHVVLGFIPSCGQCPSCARGQQNLCDLGAFLLTGRGISDGTNRIHVQGKPATPMCLLGTFSPYVTVHESAAIKILDDIPLDKAALVGCGVTTGWGSAIYAGDVRPGDTVVVVGCGGIGQNAVQGARMAGARNIVAVDPVAFKQDFAKTMGATHTYDSMAAAMEPVAEMTWGRMADVVIICVGRIRGEHVDEAVNLSAKGGTTVVTGMGSMLENDVKLNLFMLTMMQKRLQGAIFGSANPRYDVPNLLRHYMEGTLKLDELVTRTYKLEEINEGYADMNAGRNIRGMVLYDESDY